MFQILASRAAVLLSVALSGVVAFADCTHYIVTDLGIPQGHSSIALGVNNLGEVVGASGSDLMELPYCWVGGVAVPLERPGQVLVWPWRITDDGSISGAAGNGGPFLSLRWDRLGSATWTMRTLGTGIGRGINSSQQIVGAYWENTTQIARSWNSNGSFDDLEVLGAISSLAYAINDEGIAVGRVAITAGLNHPVIWSVGDPIVLTSIQGEARDISNSGAIVGDRFYWRDGVVTPINFSAHAVNERGDCVGTAAGVAKYWSPSMQTSIDLNQRIAPGADWQLIEAMDINDLGQIVGWGYKNGVLNPRAFLLTPPTCQGDLSRNGVVNLTDLAILLECFAGCEGGDIDCDRDTDLADLAMLLATFGSSCQ